MAQADLTQNLTPVSKDVFFRAVGPLNVHPTPVLSTLRDAEIASEWLMQDGSRRLIGVSLSGHSASRYFLSRGAA